MCCPGTPILLARYLSCQHPFFTSLPSPTGPVSEPPPVHLLSVSHFVVTTIVIASCGKGVTPPVRLVVLVVGSDLLSVLSFFLFHTQVLRPGLLTPLFWKWILVCFSVKSLTIGDGRWVADLFFRCSSVFLFTALFPPPIHNTKTGDILKTFQRLS